MSSTSHNTLTVTGRGVPKMLKSIKSKDSAFDFKRVKPYPLTFKFNSWGLHRGKFSHSAPTWDGWNCDWCVENWGTTWVTWDPVIHKFKGGATIDFGTQYVPPIPVITKLSEQFPRLVFEMEFIDTQSEWAGRARWSKGNLEYAVDTTDKITNF